MNKKQAEQFCIKLGLQPRRLVAIGDGMWTFDNPVNVTPAAAAQWLERFNTENRRPKERLVNRINNDIENNFWHITHQGIAFREDGVLGDGQNRLMGIIDSGKAVKLRVFLGLTKLATLAIDSGASRTTLDVITLAGQKTNNKIISTLKFYAGGLNNHSLFAALSGEAAIKKLAEHKDEVDFTFKHVPMSVSPMPAGVRAAVMRAYQHHRKTPALVNEIASFCERICTGTNMTAPMSRLRDRIHRKKALGDEARKEIYSWTEQTLEHYLSGSSKQLHLRHFAEVGELFPLEHEQVQAAK